MPFVCRGSTNVARVFTVLVQVTLLRAAVLYKAQHHFTKQVLNSARHTCRIRPCGAPGSRWALLLTTTSSGERFSSHYIYFLEPYAPLKEMHRGPHNFLYMLNAAFASSRNCHPVNVSSARRSRSCTASRSVAEGTVNAPLKVQCSFVSLVTRTVPITA